MWYACVQVGGLNRYWMLLISLHVRQGGGAWAGSAYGWTPSQQNSWPPKLDGLISLPFSGGSIMSSHLQVGHSHSQLPPATTKAFTCDASRLKQLKTRSSISFHLGIRWYHRVEIAVQSTVGQAQNWGAKELPDLVMFKHVCTYFKHFTLSYIVWQYFDNCHTSQNAGQCWALKWSRCQQPSLNGWWAGTSHP